VRVIITENQFKSIIEQATKTNKPVNQTYTLVKDRILTKNTMLGGQIKIPKGTRFTAHQYGDKKDKSTGGASFTASVDRVVGKKIKPSTVYYCDGQNAGKFWNSSANSWFYDKTKVLSGYLSKNLCGKSYGDQYYWENLATWQEQKEKKERSEACSKNGQYVDSKGKKACYETSTEYQKNYQFLKSQGLIVDSFGGYTFPTPSSPNQHYNLAALFSIKYLTDIQTNRVGWNNTECLQIGLSSLGNVKMVSKKLTSYSTSIKDLINNPQSAIWTHNKNKITPLYANFILSDFYFQWGKLVQDVVASTNNNATVYFPEGVYNFMASFYDSVNASQIKGVYDRAKPTCVGGGLTAEEGHKVIEGLQIASMFIPFVGPLLAAGLGIADSAIYFSEGKNAEAGLTMAFSVLPFASEIPALKGIGSATFEKIAEKTINKIPFNPEELKVVQTINNHKKEIETLTDNFIKKQSSNKTVQEMMNIVKNKGEDALADKIKEKTGVDIKLTNKKAVGKYVKGQTKSYAMNSAKDIDKKNTGGA
jgi:hypothetical protein